MAKVYTESEGRKLYELLAATILAHIKAHHELEFVIVETPEGKAAPGFLFQCQTCMPDPIEH